MKIDDHRRFQRMIDESLTGPIAAKEARALREHLAACAPCQKYLSASHRVIAGLRGFSLPVDPTLNARVLAALTRQVEETRTIRARHTAAVRPYNVPLRNWAAFAAALAMTGVGSALMYQMLDRLALAMQVDPAQVERGVLAFWLLPSLGAACCLLAVPREQRGAA